MNTKKIRTLLLVLMVSCLITQESMVIREKITTKKEIPLPLPKTFVRGKEPIISVYVKDRDEIQQMEFETYIQGVLGGEMPNNWPVEALKAQAILARTFAMDFFMTDQSKYEGADISTDIQEAQAWNGQAVNNNIIKAVRETRGRVVVYGNNYAKTWFHAHAGGRTAYAKEGLNFSGEEPPYIKMVDSMEPKEAPLSYGDWEAQFTKEQIRIACKVLGKEVDTVDRLEVTKRGPSGRAVTLSIDGVEVNAAEFRIKVGSLKLKSTKISKIIVEENRVIFYGSGFGHGVGLSQWGAYGLAKEGMGAREIIGYYYNNIEIRKLWK